LKILDYDLLENEVIGRLDDFRHLSLATSYKDKVTVRTVYIIQKGIDLYFLTRKSSTKYKQIIKNSNIGLCIENIQLEGDANILGHPSEDKNKDIVDFCIEHGYEDFKRYMRYKNAVLIHVEPRLITLWKKGSRELLDVKDEKAYRIG